MKQKNIEKRYLQATELRVADQTADELPNIVGYAAVFDVLSVPMWGFREKIAPGAFTKSLASVPDVRALVDHMSEKILGRTKSGTLALEENKKGLKATITPPDTTLGRDTVESIRRGDLGEMSFAFRTISDKVEIISEEEIRTLLELDLVDVSVVTYPAYQQTSVAVRAAMETVGIDQLAIARILFRADRGLTICPDDIATAKASIAQLQAALVMPTSVRDALRTRLDAATKE